MLAPLAAFLVSLSGPEQEFSAPRMVLKSPLHDYVYEDEQVAVPVTIVFDFMKTRDWDSASVAEVQATFGVKMTLDGNEVSNYVPLGDIATSRIELNDLSVGSHVFRAQLQHHNGTAVRCSAVSEDV